jgi:hypothetical protein
LTGGSRAGLAAIIAALVAMSPCAASRVGVTSTRASNAGSRPGNDAVRASRTRVRMVAKMLSVMVWRF